MIEFNTFLESEGISPAEVKLVRHQDNRLPGSPTPYQMWRAADGRLDLYQKIQRRPVFKGARLLASFVATPFSETLFVGIYEVRGVGTAALGQLDLLRARMLEVCIYTTWPSAQSSGIIADGS